MSKWMKGRVKYECGDCGMIRFMWPEKMTTRATGKEHCRDCGSTFFVEVSPAAKADATRRSQAKSDAGDRATIEDHGKTMDFGG